MKVVVKLASLNWRTELKKSFNYKKFKKTNNFKNTVKGNKNTKRNVEYTIKSSKGFSVKFPESKKLLVQCLWEMLNQKSRWNWWIIKRKGIWIIQNLNTSKPENEKFEMNLNDSWLYKFEKRNSFKIYRLHCESRNLDFKRVISELLTLQKISEYSINSVFCADEFWLFYKLAPDSSIEPSKKAGRKKKRRGTYFDDLCL